MSKRVIVAKDYLDVGAWGSDFMVARLWLDYWSKDYCLDDLRDDLVFHCNVSLEHADFVIDHIKMVMKKTSEDIARYDFDSNAIQSLLDDIE